MNAFVNGEEVDMDVSQVGISYAIGDPLNPGIVSGTKSTTFRMPATNRVRAAMGGPGMQERPIGSANILEFRKGGTVYLSQGIRPIEWDRNEVRSVSLGNNAGWIGDLKNVKLNEMDLGESPRITQALMEDTWFDEDSLLYFPLIDYGYGWDVSVEPDLADLRPGLRCHRVLKKAFGDLGYSLRIKGGLNRVWKKYVMPCVEEVKAGQRDIDISTLTLAQESVSGHFYTSGVPQALPDVVDTYTDPGGTYIPGTRYYTAPYDMELEVFMDFTYTNLGNAQLTFVIFDTGSNAILSTPYVLNTYGVASTVVTKSFSLGIVTVAQGQTVAAGLNAQFLANPITSDFVVRFVPKVIPYQEDITITIAEGAPRLSAWDVLAAINYNRCLAFDTDDRTKVVTISYDEDKYRPIAEGRSLVGREDHTDPPVKGSPLKTKRLVFGWKEDSDDYYLSLANASAGTRGWGGLIREIEGGTLKETKVEMPFAATAMRTYPTNVTIPVMRENAVRAVVPGEDDRNFKRTPRLLLADGFATGDWRFDSVPLAVYPKCFFVFPGETDLCMSFGPETLIGTSGSGTVASHYGGYLRRLEKSKTLSIDLMLYDHELKGLDMGVPVEVQDDFTAGWYYFTEIKQKKFGVDEPTRCELIQC